MSRRWIVRSAALAIAAGALLRIVLAYRLFTPSSRWVGDARVFLRITDGLLDGSLPPDVWVWPPGFPLLGAALSIPAGSGGGLVLASLLLGVALPVAVLAAGVAAGRPIAAATAALILAFAPEAVLASTRPLSDAASLTLLVGAGLLLEVGSRRGGPGFSALAGVCGGLAVLTRPEALIAVVGFPLAMLGRRRAIRVVAPYAGALLVLILPYVAGLHAASGHWGLTLKPQLNILKMSVYEGEQSYGDMRAAWGTALDELRAADGQLDPTRVAAAASVPGFLRSGAAFASWRGHLVQAGSSLSPFFLGIVALGLVGLALPRGDDGRERAMAAIATLPFLAVPVFVTPIGRFLLPLFPGVAWGLGSLVARLVGDREKTRTTRLRAAATIGLVAIVAGIGASWRHADRARLDVGIGEIEAALNEGRLDTAGALLDQHLRAFPEEAALLDRSGRLEEAHGDPVAAEAAYRRAVAAGGSPLRLADLLARTGRLADAEEAIAPLRRSPPETLTYWLLEANLAFVSARWDDAAAAFRQAEVYGGPRQEITYNLGLALHRAGRVPEAIRELRRAESGPSPAVAERARVTRIELEALAAPPNGE